MKRSYTITGNGYTQKSEIEALKIIIKKSKKLILKTTDFGVAIIISLKNHKLNIAAVSKNKIIVEYPIKNHSRFIQKFIEDGYAVDNNISVISIIAVDQPAIHISFYD